MKKDEKIKLPENQTEKDADSQFPGYPVYPEGEDIYLRSVEEKNINPEDISKRKDSIDNHIERTDAIIDTEIKEGLNVKDLDDLDIPGSELDDEQENIGSEDEENNYYSLGGDDHNDLDEDNGA
jgi:hypothetical protein